MTDNETRIGFVRNHPRIKAHSQENALIAAGYDPGKIYVHGRGAETLDEAINSLRPGDTFGVYHLGLLGAKRESEDDPPPRTVLRDAIEALLTKGVTVEEVESGRTCKDRDDLVKMVMDAYAFTSNLKRKKAGQGRPRNKPLDPDEYRRLEAIWRDVRYDRNIDAVKAMGRGWTVSKAYQVFGKSNRKAGKRKQK